MTQFKRIDGQEGKRPEPVPTKILKLINAETHKTYDTGSNVQDFDIVELIQIKYIGEVSKKGIIRCYDKGDDPINDSKLFTAFIGDEFN